MNETSISRYKFSIIVGSVIIIILAVVYFLIRAAETSPPAQTESLSTPDLIPVAVSSPDSPISPIISPISPLTPSDTAQEEAALNLMFENGQRAFEQGQYDVAKETFEAMLAINPNSARAYDARGTVYTALKDYDAAITDYTKAIEIDPIYPPSYYNRGRVYSLQERYIDALNDLQRSIDLAPFFFGYRANGNIGLIHHKLGDYDQALEAFNNSISYTDTNADVYYFRAETYTAQGNFEAAIQDYQAAIQRFPNYDAAYRGLGYAYFKNGQTEQSLDALNQSLSIAPNQPETLLVQALVFLALGQAANAEDAIDQAITGIDTLPPDQKEVVLNRVNAELEQLVETQPDRAETITAIQDRILAAE